MKQSRTSYPVASLYVGDLHPEVTEAILFDRFSSIGPVLSIRVCRDIVSRRSLGYAYVNFQHSSDAETALGNLNYELLMDRPMRIMWSQRDPSLRRSGQNNIFIKNLDKQIDNKALYETFTAFGPILSCKVATDETGASKGYGFVHFESEEAAKKAIDQVNGMLLNDKKVFVGKFMSRKERLEKFGNQPQRYTNVYVKNFGEEVTDDQLTEFFKPFGEIVSCTVMKDSAQRSRGFGFCCFANPDDARRAVDELHGKELEGKTVYVNRAQKKSERMAELRVQFNRQKAERLRSYQGVNLYIKNLDDDITDDGLRSAFSAYGTITSAKVMTHDGRSRGFGFVCFSSPEEATKALTEMNGQIIGSKPLYVALAQRKDDRKAQLAQQFTMRGGPLRIPQGAGQQMGQMYPAPMFMPVPPQGGRFMPHQMPPMRPRWNQQMPRGAGPQQPMIPSHFLSQMRLTGGRGGRSSGRMQPTQAQRQTGQPRQSGKMGHRSGYAGGGQQQRSAQAAPEPSMPSAKPQVDASADLKNLSQSSPQEQKQMLGEKLFPRIQTMEPEQAGKITGMLLEIDNAEILHMLDSEESLKVKVKEAVNVLQAHQKEASSAPTQPK